MNGNGRVGANGSNDCNGAS